LKIGESIKEEVTQLKVNVSTKLEVAFLKVIQQIRKLINKKYIDINP
jgi:fructose/tagatose bisphosphate aldolase